MAGKPQVIAAASGALGLGAFAAAVGGCCGAPWAVALLGVTGAVGLARLAFLLPYALIGAALLLGVAFWSAYRPAPACATADARAPAAAASRASWCGLPPCSSLPLPWWLSVLSQRPSQRASMRIVAWMGCLAIATVVVGCSRADGAHGIPPYVALDDQASELRADFNRAKGSVRLLFVVDPICPGCLRGLDDMNRDLLAGTDDPRLVTFVVHEPVLGAARVAPWLRTTASHDVPAAAGLLHNQYVKHYWNQSGSFGRLLADSVDLKNSRGRVYAWDVWLLYGPDATWSGTGPPRPILLMQQLGELRDSSEFPHLDSKAFSQKVRALLATLPPRGAGPKAPAEQTP